MFNTSPIFNIIGDILIYSTILNSIILSNLTHKVTSENESVNYSIFCSGAKYNIKKKYIPMELVYGKNEKES